MEYDLIIIGAGPGGYVAAIRAGQSGLKTAVIEKAKVGGVCLNWGCIPTKSLLESAKRFHTVKKAPDFGIDGIDLTKLSFNWPKAVKRTQRTVKRLTKGVQFLLKKNNVKLIQGTASINADLSISVDNMLMTAKNIIIATGSRPSPVSIDLPDDVLVQVDQLMEMEALPEHTVVLGSGPHAVELAQFFKMVGKEVSLVTNDGTLLPDADPFLSDHAVSFLEKEKINLFLAHELKGFENGQLSVKMKEGTAGADEEKAIKQIPCDKLINLTPRTGVIPQSAVNLEQGKGFLRVNNWLHTSIENIYAVGDVNGRSIYAHAASAQGLYVVDLINGVHEESLFDMEKFPMNIYTHPEMAHVGLTETQVKQMHTPYKVSNFPLSGNGKALIEGDYDGQLRMLSDKRYGEVLGVQIIAPRATDMIAEASVVIQMEGTVHDIAHTIHAHPTVSEIFMEAGFEALERPVHK
ncbi:MAG: dihydrolipoyl dehydrogenase [bacterium]|nr:dihydrolipoyl dehydrogenase [bacterium]